MKSIESMLLVSRDSPSWAKDISPLIALSNSFLVDFVTIKNSFSEYPKFCSSSNSSKLLSE